MTTDESVVSRIERLMEEERSLRGSQGAVSDDEHQRIESLETELDQCWDLLRQRRAKRESGEPADLAAPRDPDTVEHYAQ